MVEVNICALLCLFRSWRQLKPGWERWRRRQRNWRSYRTRWRNRWISVLHLVSETKRMNEWGRVNGQVWGRLSSKESTAEQTVLMNRTALEGEEITSSGPFEVNWDMTRNRTWPRFQPWSYAVSLQTLVSVLNHINAWVLELHGKSVFSLCSWPCHYVHWREDGSRWEIYLCWKCMGDYSHSFLVTSCTNVFCCI